MLPALIPTIGSLVSLALDKALPGDSEETKKLKVQIQADLEKSLMNLEAKQLDINLAETQFAGRTWPTWREVLGYICAAAVGYHFLIQQFMSFVMNAVGHPVPLPELEMSGLMTILSAMLGVHFVDSRYNSEQGRMPKPERIIRGAKEAWYKKGKLVDGIWQPDK